MNIIGVSYGPPQIESRQIVREVTTTAVATQAAEDSAPVTLSGVPPSGLAGDGTLSATGFARTGIAAYSSIAS